MVKVLRANVCLTMDEYNQLVEFYGGVLNFTKIRKKVDIMDGENKLTFNINIENNIDYMYIHIGNEPNSVLKGEYFIEDCKKIIDIITVKKYNYTAKTEDGKETTYEIYFNINVSCDRKYFPDKYYFYKEKYNILNESKKNNSKMVENEIIYADFKNEEELALASYCLLLNPNSLINMDYIFKLYEDKLSYVGIDLKDYSKKWNQHFNSLEFLEAILSYISFLKGNKKAVINTISITGSLLYNNYITTLKK